MPALPEEPCPLSEVSSTDMELDLRHLAEEVLVFEDTAHHRP